jgi:hypothetical protein
LSFLRTRMMGEEKALLLVLITPLDSISLTCRSISELSWGV